MRLPLNSTLCWGVVCETPELRKMRNIHVKSALDPSDVS